MLFLPTYKHLRIYFRCLNILALVIGKNPVNDFIITFLKGNETTYYKLKKTSLAISLPHF